MTFPFVKSDLMNEISFCKMCKDKWYPINKETLSIFDKMWFLSPIKVKGSISFYSKHQFYVLKFIRDNRYNIEGFIRTFVRYNGEKDKKLINFFNICVSNFDDSFKRYLNKIETFFQVYYKIRSYCIECWDYIDLNIKNITDNDREYKSYIVNKTYLIEKQSEFWKNNKLYLTDDEEDSIKWFIGKYLNKYKNHIELSNTLIWSDQRFKKIPEFYIVKDFLVIFNTVEIFENISWSTLKEVRVNRGGKVWTLSYCYFCWKMYTKWRVNQVVCWAEKCKKAYNSEYKKKQRVRDPNYGK